MYSRAKILGHPIHPMLVAFPVAFYTGALAGFAVYAANGHQFWLNLAIALSVVGAASALIAALPGVIDLAFGIPRTSQARLVGIAHGNLNLAALGLFIASAIEYIPNWNGPPADATLGLALATAGVALTIVSGTLGWKLVQTYHVGIRLTPGQAEDERLIQPIPPAPAVARHRKVG
jgi:uncharacterized membrane protein